MNQYAAILALEAEHWNRKNQVRLESAGIPLEADIRRAAKGVANGQDPEINRIIEGSYRDLFISALSRRTGGRVLDVCCGPGWLALELGRRGQVVDAYDVSEKAIELARRMLAENPYREQFGEVNYHVQDVTSVDLGKERYDAVSGWSAFHHLPDLPGFMDRVWLALKPGGIVATMDDLHLGGAERLLARVVTTLLPIRNTTYLDKATRLTGKLIEQIGGARQPSTPPVESPLEAISTHEVQEVLARRFKIITNVRYNAFVHTAAFSLDLADPARYRMVRALTAMDRALCRAGILKGFYRIIIARKEQGAVR